MDGHGSDTWAIVEVMGHKRFAGRVSEHSAFGGSWVRIEVPAVQSEVAFEKLFSQSSIYCITPCTEAVARKAAAQFRERPFVVYGQTPAGFLDFEDDHYKGD